MNRPSSTLIVVVHPGARRENVGPLTERGLKVSVFAPPEKGKANKAVLNLLSRQLDVPKSRLAIFRGEKSRLKEIRIEGLCEEELKKRLTPFHS
jgi:uncharacterized protein (TIGR00251 family)